MRILVGSVVVLFLTGCNRGPTVVEVRGTVKLQSRPLENVLVEFWPDGEKSTTGPSSTGATDKNGQYTLTTNTNLPGAVVGHHRVVVRDLNAYGDKFMTSREYERSLEKRGGAKPRPRLAAVFADGAQTPLRREVKSDGPQVIDLDVTP